MDSDDTIESLREEIVRLRTLLAERDHEISKQPELQKLWQTLRKAELEANRNGPQCGDADPASFLESLSRDSKRPPIEDRSIGMVTPAAAMPAVMLGTPVWLTDDQLPPGRPGIGFRCRRCGHRVKGERHLDTRLLCAACLPVVQALGMVDK
jgi:hypothetical protein